VCPARWARGSVATSGRRAGRLKGPRGDSTNDLQMAADRARSLCAVRWYLRYSLSLRDVEELLEERGLEADHTTVWRWVQRYGPELEQRLRRHLKPTNKSWRVDETYVRVKGRWCYLYRAIDSAGATIDFLLSALHLFGQKRAAQLREGHRAGPLDDSSTTRFARWSGRSMMAEATATALDRRSESVTSVTALPRRSLVRLGHANPGD
jgi:transposase, IS6 family